jgi:hypothetical protein
VAGVARREPADEAHLKSLLAPYPSDGMMCWPVSPRVGSVKMLDLMLEHFSDDTKSHLPVMLNRGAHCGGA